MGDGKITALIAVKGQSERVPRKNLRPFANSSLLEVKLNQLQQADIFDEIVVSSEDQEVLKICESYPVKAHERDPFYSTSSVPMSEVYEYLAKEVETEYIAWIPVTNPLVDASIYRQAVQDFRALDRSQFDSLLSVHEVHEYLYYKNKPLNFTRDPWLRSQDLKDVYAINFAINILSKKSMMTSRSTIGDNHDFFVIAQDVAIDIDYMEDFVLAETLFKKKYN